jgi:hypothetical protein
MYGSVGIPMIVSTGMQQTRMARSEIWDTRTEEEDPDCAAIHPGYLLECQRGH